jgi:hypothetical protein
MKPAPFFFLLVGFAAVSAVADLAWQKHLSARVAQAEHRCREENDAGIARFDKEKDAASPWKMEPMVCDDTLSGLSPGTAVGVQKELVVAYRARSGHSYPGYFLAGGLLLLGFLPAAWYFLLRRLAEVSDAVRGGRS